MLDTVVKIPNDAANTGKTIRAIGRAVGSNAAAIEHLMHPQDSTDDKMLRVLTNSDLMVSSLKQMVQELREIKELIASQC